MKIYSCAQCMVSSARVGKIYNSADSYFTHNLRILLEQEDFLPIVVKVYSSVQKCGFKCKGDVRLGKIYNSADFVFYE